MKKIANATVAAVLLVFLVGCQGDGVLARPESVKPEALADPEQAATVLVSALPEHMREAAEKLFPGATEVVVTFRDCLLDPTKADYIPLGTAEGENWADWAAQALPTLLPAIPLGPWGPLATLAAWFFISPRRSKHSKNALKNLFTGDLKGAGADMLRATGDLHSSYNPEELRRVADKLEAEAGVANSHTINN